MNSPLIHNSDDHDSHDPVRSPGRSLRMARQSKGFEIASISSQLHLHPDKIEALEQDRYTDLAGSVFVSGYIRNYARLLGLDPEPLLAAYQAADPNAVKVPRRVVTTPTTPRREARSNDLVVRLVSLVIILGIAGLFGIWWMNRGAPMQGLDLQEGGPSPNELAAPMDQPPADEPVMDTSLRYTPEPAVAPIDGGPAAFEVRDPALPAAPAESPAEPAAADSTNEALAESESMTTPEPIATTDTAAQTTPTPQAPIAASTEDASPSTTEVVLEFSGPCWVDVRDSTRTFKLFGEQNSGDRFVLEGTPPYDMVLGNAAAVRIEVNGEPFDLASHSKGNVARFQLDPNDAL